MPDSDKTPRWMQRLIDKVLSSMTPFESSGDIHWRWFEPETPQEAWQIYCFPTEVELLGGPLDGKVYTAGYTLCVNELLRIFKPGYHVHWLSRPRRGPGEFGGACLQVDGHIGERYVLLNCFTYPPREVGATVLLTQDGMLKPKVKKKADEPRRRDGDDKPEEV